MCTIAILFRVADVPLVVAANRDELYARPTRPPEVLGPSIVGGVDALSGGTWLAVHRAGRFAAVTNQRAMDPPPVGLRSRGLVVRELVATADPDAYLADIDPRLYASMNLVWGDADRVRTAYLRRETGEKTIEELPPGVHVLCNDRLGTDEFPRGDRLHAAITAALAEDRAWPELSRRIRIALGDHTHASLEDTPASHLPRELAHELTATCIHTEHYGTRSSTLLAIDHASRRGSASLHLGHGRVLSYLHADGPPCVTPFLDRTELLDAA